MVRVDMRIFVQNYIHKLNDKFILKYTTVSGIDGFDGSRKEAPKAVVKAIE